MNMLESGRLLAHYRLVEELGQGGMGVVWKAVDQKLDREVAIKFLPEQFAVDPERVGRFEREAKLLASLNHRNIASIYGHEQVGDLRFLVMELVEGEDLAQRLATGPLPIDEALEVCHQLARALENAHEKGILHRDLKPANVRVTHDGRVKVLDFGLAKAFETEARAEGDPTMSPTLTSVETRAGIILGTAAYMSPEQARGKPLDKRTDIWAFGCLLYECLTGQSPFRGDTVTDTLASIVKTPADETQLPAGTPPRVRALLQRCLEKDVRTRLRDIGEARIELQRLIGSDSISDSNLSVEAPVPSLPRRFSTGWLFAALLIGALMGVGLWTALGLGGGSSSAGGDEVVRFSIAFPPDLEVPRWQVAPDGATIAYVGRPRPGRRNADDSPSRLYVRPLNALESRTVEGSDGVDGFTFSPDGRWLAVVAPVAPRSTKRRLLKVPIDGSSPPLALLDWRDEWTTPLLWLPDGDLVVRATGGRALVRIPSDGGTPGEPVELRNDGYEGQFRHSDDPRAVFPDGIHVLGTATTYSERGYETSVAAVDLETGESRILIDNGSSPTWSRTGHLVFARSDGVLATAFDRDRMAPAGNTVAVQAGFRAIAGYGDTDFSLSRTGTFLHWPGGIYGDKRQLALVERDGGAGFKIGDPWSDDLRFFDGDLTVSDDGQRLAAVIANDSGLYETWISDKSRPRLSRFVYEAGRDCVPEAWMNDGDSLVYACRTTDEASFLVRSVDSTEEPRTLMTVRSPVNYEAVGVLPDGSALVLNRWFEGKSNVMLLPLGPDADGTPPEQVWLEDARAGKFSPDGRWLVYFSGVSGRGEVYIRPLREGNRLGREIPVSTNGGFMGGWEVDGSTLRLTYHHDDDMWSVEVGRDGRISAPERLGNIGNILRKSLFHVHLRDGRMVVALKGEGEDTPDRVNVVLNWTAELNERLAAQ